MTLISHQYKFIFLANAKCGSTTVHTLLKPYAEVAFTRTIRSEPLSKHDTLREVIQYFQDNHLDISQYYIFTILRNPYQRMVSWYLYEAVGKRKTKLSFHQYLQQKKFYPVQNYQDFAEDPDKQVKVDYCMKLENLAEDLQTVCQKLGIPLNLQNLPRKNPGKIPPPSLSKVNWYSKKSTRRLIKEYFQSDFRVGNYKR